MSTSLLPADGSLGSAATRRPVEVVAGGSAAVTVVAMAAVRLAVNAPGGLSGTVASVYGPLEVVALAVPAGAALALGLVATGPLARVGLVTMGVFGTIATIAPITVVPAAGAIAAGGTLAVASRLLEPVDWRTAKRGLVPAAVLAGAVLALASTGGLAGTSARAVGSGMALTGLAATPTLVPTPRRAWLLGGVAFIAVLYLGLTAPFVTGAATLVALAALGVPFLLVALG